MARGSKSGQADGYQTESRKMATMLWQILADRVNALIGSKLKVPLTGADMVQIMETWKQIQKESKQ